MSLFCAGAWGADQYSFRVYRSPVSVADDRIADLYEDPSGTLWVAVWGKGVCRIDGTDSRTFTSADGLPSDWVRCLAPDQSGGLWVGGADGIAHISGTTIRTYTVDTTPALPADSVRSVTVLRSGAICFGLASGGLVAIGGHPLHDHGMTVDPREWVVVGYPEIPSHEGVDDVMQAADGSIWLALHNGEVFQFRDGKWINHGPEHGLTVAVNYLHQDRRGRIWGAGGLSLAVFEADRWTILDTVAIPQVRVAAETESGDIILGTDRGLWVLDATGMRELDMGPDIGTPEVSALLFGVTGAPWVGTREGLVRGTVPIWATHLRTGTGVPILATPLIAGLNAPPLSADSEGNLIQFEGDHWKTVASIQDERFRPKWFSNPRDGLIWALCEDDAICFREAGGDVVEVVPLPSGVQTIRLEWGPDGKPWLMGSKGVFMLENGKWQPLRRHADTRARWAYDIDTAKDGTVYVCYESGIDVWKDGQVRSLRFFDHLPQGGHYTAVRCMRDGTVWFGTYGNGIVVYDGSDATHITQRDGLVSNHVSQIFEASDGTTWVAYRRKGVSSFRDGRWIYYGHRHGLPNASGAKFGEHPAGTIWFAADKSGILRYAPEPSAPETTVTAATATIAAGGTGIFSFNGIDAWHRTLPRDVAYSWRVVPALGPEPPWGPVQSSSVAAVSGLPAGEYLFEVRATDEDRNIDATPSVFSVTVEPPFYARLGFVVPVSILFALVLASMASLYLKQRRLQESERSLLKSEASLGEAQRIALVGNWEWNVTRNTMVCSPQVSRILGWPSIRRTPSVSAIRDTIHPDDLPAMDDAIRESLATDAPLDFDHRILRPDGEERFIYQRGELTKDRLTGDTVMRGILQDITERKRIQTDRERLIAELQGALAHIKTLRGLIPICSSCKRIRDDSGYWNQLETFIKARSEAEFSHAICPDCAKQIYGVDDLMNDSPQEGNDN